LSEKSISRTPVKIVVEGLGEAEGELIRYMAPRTVEAILRSLPLEGRAALWKEEVYFEIPIKMGGEKPAKTVKKGTLAYWPMGNAVCIFYGETQPYSPINVIGLLTKNLDLFRKVKSGMRIKIEKL
jgi:hypothetical protein